MAVAGQPRGFGVNYVINADRPTHMDVLGTIGNAIVAEQWDIDPADSSIRITGQVGSSAESLEISTVNGNWHQVDGRIGTQDVHLTLSGPPGHASIAWDGTVGGQPIHEELEFQEAGWRFSGKLGTALDTDIYIDVKDGEGDEKIASGSGTVAGVGVDYLHDVAYGATPA
jgi:hypothetical protein